MKKNSFFTSIFCLLFFLFAYNTSEAQVTTWIKVGKIWQKIRDSGHQTEVLMRPVSTYYHLFDFTRYGLECAGTQFSCVNWTDENGTVWPVKISGSAYGNADELFNMFALENSEGLTIKRYWRYKPPTIVVDGQILNDPFPLKEDELAPEKIPGTADVMVESFIRTYGGLDIHQRVLGWSQTHHDDYVIYDWTITNTGNIDRDDEIETLQTLNGFYILRTTAPMPASDREAKEWSAWDGCRPGEDLRIMYNYPHRDKGANFDDFGDIRGGLTAQGYINGPCYEGDAQLHMDKSADDETDDPIQPQMHCVWNYRLFWLKLSDETLSPPDLAMAYEVHKYGLPPIMGTPYMTDAYPGTYHEVSPDAMGYKYVNDFPGWGMGWHTITFNSCGPYTLKPGDDLRYVYSHVWGGIDLHQSWRLGRQWLDGTLEPPPGCVKGVSDNLPPQYTVYPELYAADAWASEYTNWAKDCWVATGKDSLYNNARASQWAFENDYDIPVAPPPPSIEVNSRPDRIEINWGDESESASDFAGYRVYRAIPTEDSTFYYPIFECGEGTANALTHTYNDVTAQRGIGYTYYVTAFDDGVSNKADYNGKRESLESGMYLNMTTMKPAHLTRPEGTLSTVRVVPNPYHISAVDIQFGSGEPDKIMFMDIPGYCTIKIYSESGDLVKTLEHTTGSGDESWGVLKEEHSTSNTGQIIVSGIYIAHIKDNKSGESTYVKFVIVR